MKNSEQILNSDLILAYGLKTPNSTLQQVYFYFRCKPMISYIGIKTNMVLFVRQFVFLKKKKQREKNINFFSFFCVSVFLIQIWYGWKDLVETFPTHFFFFLIFGVLFDLLQFFEVLWKNGFFLIFQQQTDGGHRKLSQRTAVTGNWWSAAASH